MMAPYRNLLVLLVQSYINNFLLICLIISPLLFEPCLALYEDQVGKFDWRQQYIGAVKFAHFDYGSSSRRVIVASEQNVLAAINPSTSQVVWRQILEPSAIGSIHALGGTTEIITVTGIEALVRSWDATTGRLNWETALLLPERNEQVESVFYKVDSKEQIVTIIERQRKVSSFDVRRHNYRTGKMISSFHVAAPWFDDKTSCEIISSVHFVCVSVQTKTIYSLMLDRANTFHLTPLATLGITNSDIDVTIVNLIHDDVNVRHLFAVKLATDRYALLKAKDTTAANKNAIELVATFEKVSDISAAQTDDEVLVFLLSHSSTTKENTLKVFSVDSKSYLDGLEDKLSYPEHHGRPEKVFVHVVPKRDGGYGYRLLIRTESHSLILVQHPCKMVWAREEALASILSVEMVDLPVSESDAQVEEQFENANANVMVMFYKRLTSHFFQLQSSVTRLVLGLHKDVTGAIVETEKAKLVRDEFNIHKVVVLTTAVGKIYGIDSRTGTILWQQLVPQLVPHERYGMQKLPLYVLRTTAHYPQQPLCVILGLNKLSQQSAVFAFNPITGQPVDGKNGLLQLDYRIVQTIQLPQHNTEFIRGLVLIDQQFKVHVYPRSVRDVAYNLARVLYAFVADVDTGELHGLSLRFSTSKELIAGRVWSLAFSAPKNTITNVVMKRPIEHVHSQGRVMTDRSVLYKYLNPNLAVVTTEEKTTQDQKSSSLSVYLVDVVSGQIIYSAVHKRAKGPVHVVHSENWIVYLFYCEKYRRVEASVLELYEGKVQSNTTAFSSLTPPPIPMVEQQAYIFPSSVDAVAVTNTEKGITSKHLLLALPMGGIVEIPKSFLDPRRSLFPSQEQREEGIIPYIPELPIPTENIINYNLSVFRIRNIYTSSTGLESTSLVLAYGLDLFYTRVTPSRTFDILKDDFDHWLIVAVLSALIIASYATKVLAAKKALKQAWK